MANVLDYNTYQFPLSKGRKPTARELHLRDWYDYNALSPLKRRYFAYIQGLALNLLVWIACNYDIAPATQEEPPVESAPCEVMIEVMTPFLTNQACAILNYKRRAEAQDIPGVPNCTAADVQRQLELLFYDNPNIINDIDFDSDLSLYETFAFGDCSWRVRKRVAPMRLPGIFKTFVVYVLSCLRLAEDDPHTVGTTKGDRMFERGATLGFPSSKGQGAPKQTVNDDGGPEQESDEDGENRDPVNGSEGQTAGRKRKRAS